MADKPFVLDSSAIIALLEDEVGADRVEAILRHEQVLLPWPVLMEVYYISRQEGGEAEADRRYALMKQLRAEILWHAEEQQVLTAAQFKARHRISLADALIASYAHQRQATLLHKDPEYEALADQIGLESLPYKR